MFFLYFPPLSPLFLVCNKRISSKKNYKRRRNDKKILIFSQKVAQKKNQKKKKGTPFPYVDFFLCVCEKKRKDHK